MVNTTNLPAPTTTQQPDVAAIIADPLKRFRVLEGLPPEGGMDDAAKTKLSTYMNSVLQDFLRAYPDGELEGVDTDGQKQKYKFAADGKVKIFKNDKFEDTDSKTIDPTDPLSATLLSAAVQMSVRGLKLKQDHAYHTEQLRIVDKMAGITGPKSAELLRDIKKQETKADAIAFVKQKLPEASDETINHYMYSLWRLKELQNSIKPDSPYVSNGDDPAFQKLTAMSDIAHGLGRGEDIDTLGFHTKIPADQMPQINDMIFSKEVYDAFNKRGPGGSISFYDPVIPAELLGYPPGTPMLTKHQVCQIARERFIERAAAEGIAPQDISKAMLEGRFNLSPQDLHMAFRGGSPAGNYDCTQAWNRDFLPKRPDGSDGTMLDLKNITVRIPQGYKPGGGYDVQTVTGMSGADLLKEEADRRISSFSEDSICAYTYFGGQHDFVGHGMWDRYRHLRETIYYPNVQKENLGVSTADPKQIADDAIANAPKGKPPEPTAPETGPVQIVRPAA